MYCVDFYINEVFDFLHTGCWAVRRKDFWGILLIQTDTQIRTLDHFIYFRHLCIHRFGAYLIVSFVAKKLFLSNLKNASFLCHFWTLHKSSLQNK